MHPFFFPSEELTMRLMILQQYIPLGCRSPEKKRITPGYLLLCICKEVVATTLSMPWICQQ